MQSVKDISNMNFHDAKVSEIEVENDYLTFVITNGPNNDLENKIINNCKLKFKLVFENEAKITYSKFLHTKILRRLYNDVYYKTREFSSLKEFAKLIKKKGGFEIINWNYSDSMEYINFDCVINGIEPLRIELDIISAEILIDDKWYKLEKSN